jgi:hypothetical protein
MRSCDVRGGGPGVSKQYGNAYHSAGVWIEGDYSIGEFYNVSFTDLRATLMSALYAQGSSVRTCVPRTRPNNLCVALSLIHIIAPPFTNTRTP